MGVFNDGHRRYAATTRNTFTMSLCNSRHRVTLETVSTVLTFTRPSLQRELDEQHVLAMVADQKAEYGRSGCFSMLQSITVADLQRQIFVLDGQHRIRAFDFLRAEGELPVDTVLIPVVYYSVNDVHELAQYYTRINQHRPVHPLELRSSWQSFEKPFVEWMARTFPRYMKAGGATRCPHIGMEQLKTELNNRSGELSRTCDGDSGVLIRAVSCFNECIAGIYGVRGGGERSCQDDDRERDEGHEDEGARRHPPSPRIPEDVMKRLRECERKTLSVSNTTDVSLPPPRKKKKNDDANSGSGVVPCYLGAFRRFEWLDVCVFSIRHQSPHHGCGDVVSPNTCWALLLGCRSSSTSSSSKRVRIPQSVRKLVWNKTNPAHTFLGTCYTCGHQLSFESMECGHVIAHALGGSTDLGNLIAVCRPCNADMGIQDMEAYRDRIRKMRGDEDPMEEDV